MINKPYYTIVLIYTDGRTETLINVTSFKNMVTRMTITTDISDTSMPHFKQKIYDLEHLSEMVVVKKNGKVGI